MSPLDRRRRRPRRILGTRARALIVPGVVALVVVALVVGGATRTGSESTSYWRAVDRSYADQARVVVAESTEVGDELTAVLAATKSDTRPELQAALDTLARAGDGLAQAAATLASPPPSGGVGTEVASAMSERSRALTLLRSTIDRLLDMTPLPVVGARPGDSRAGAPLSAASAVIALGQVGSLLERADLAYASARRTLGGAPGHATLPAGSWVRSPATWSPAAAQAMVAVLTSAPALAPVQRVVLLTDDVAITPPAVPAAATPAGTSVLPPTRRLSITVVVANQGNVAETGVKVAVQARPATGAALAPGSRTISLAAGRSTAVTLPDIRVVPGHTYSITLSVAPPAGQAAASVSTDTFVVEVAPAGPATVTAVSPREGPRSGGTAVVIVGTGFTSVSAVMFGHAPARYVETSKSQITAIAPPGTGTVAVSVVNPGGTSATSTADRFTYTGRSARHR
jgi:IPT/TIG domain